MGHEQAKARLGRVVGKYTLERVIGSGGMATVYEASHRNGHRVAVKMLKPFLAVGSEVRARFLREGYAANRVGHPGAVRVLDDDVTPDGLVFLVMELLDGWTLDALAKRHHGTLGVRLALGVGKQLLDVLRAAHDAGIVHRDIKPENVFIQHSGKLKILDFGVARIRSPRDGTTTTTGRMLGTPAFMPPEQAYGRRDEVDARSDLWSVGATLFTVLSGRVVHLADTAEATLIKAATEPAPSLASVTVGVPACIAHVVDRALMADKAARWPSATSMLEALEQAHQAAFGAPVMAVIDLGADAHAGASTCAPSVAPRATWATDAPTWAAPAVVVAALLISASVFTGDSAHATPSEGAAPDPTEEPQAAPVRGQATPPSAPPPTVAAQLASPSVDTRTPQPRLERAPANRTSASAPPKATKAMPVPAAPLASRVCGFDFDEEGRKWPKRCP